MSRASLPMYDLREMQVATDEFWQGLARAFRREGIDDVPDRLEQPVDYEAHWLSPDLLFSQTCGYPLRHALKDRVAYVATPSYAVDGCGHGTYRSVILVNEGSSAKTLADLRGRVVAFNDPHSHSGMNVLRAMIAPLSTNGAFFGQVIESGRHEASIRTVAEGEADVATIDCVTYATLERYRPDAVTGVRVLGLTAEAPTLPFITALDAGPDRIARLRAGLARAFADPALAGAREALFLEDVVVLPDDAYLAIDRMEQDAIDRGYPVLA
jgi:ABC-type phosphate/phosphonate transport system substrate-binding protein